MSINKPYVRPIVRDREVKIVEYGAKVNEIQVDGILYIVFGIHAANEVQLAKWIGRRTQLDAEN